MGLVWPGEARLKQCPSANMVDEMRGMRSHAAAVQIKKNLSAVPKRDERGAQACSESSRTYSACFSFFSFESKVSRTSVDGVTVDKVVSSTLACGENLILRGKFLRFSMSPASSWAGHIVLDGGTPERMSCMA